MERWELPGILKSRICPARLVSDDSREWLRLYGHYQAGHLLIAGGIFDQPALYLDAMNVIAGAIAREKQNGRESKI